MPYCVLCVEGGYPLVHPLPKMFGVLLKLSALALATLGLSLKINYQIKLLLTHLGVHICERSWSRPYAQPEVVVLLVE